MSDRYGKEHSPDTPREECTADIDWNTSMAEEHERGGWSKVNTPVGAKPADADKFGTSGGN